VSAPVQIRDEPADGPAAQALFADYVGLLRERLGAGFEPEERIVATAEAFAGPGAAWLVLYAGGRPVACGGLRPLGPDAAEVKRMFVAPAARGRGHARALLGELERRARAGGRRRVGLLTTEVLTEARALYAAEGYRVVRTQERSGRMEYWMEKEL
jgi:GNAT superfamily N-acetyltransferase